MSTHDAEGLLPLSAHDLSAQDGRQAFLWSLWDDHQDAGVIPAVACVWDALAPPQAARCNQMAQQLGLPGKGKVALLRVIERFLQEIDSVDIPDLPNHAEYDDGDAWNADCLAHFARVEETLMEVVRRYEAVLDGREVGAEPRSGKVINGPWRARRIDGR